MDDFSWKENHIPYEHGARKPLFVMDVSYCYSFKQRLNKLPWNLIA